MCITKRFGLAWICAVATAGTLVSTGASAQQTNVDFIPGTYALAETCPNYGDVPLSPCDAPETYAMVITAQGSLVNVAITGLTPGDQGQDASFTVPNDSPPAGFEPGGSPYFTVYNNDVTNASWDTAAYPYITFWSTIDGAGIGIGDSPSGDGNNLTNLFEASQTADEFVLGVPEPESWALMIMGFGMIGLTARRRSGRTA